MLSIRHGCALLICAMLTAEPAQAQGKVKVFLMAGQSNVVGYGHTELGRGGNVVAGWTLEPGAIGSLRYQVDNDPANYGHLVDASGDWVVRDDAWVWSTTDGTEKGPLTTGFGASSRIGPEYGFGLQVADHYSDPVLVIKTGWGGKSLGNDFLPPSAESYPEPTSDGDKGYYYKRMLDTYNNVVDNLDTQFPALAGREVDLEGFVWFQGYNDRFNDAWTDAYEDNLAHLIEDVRADLDEPGLPFVVANTGNGGYTQFQPNPPKIMAAQEAVADPVKYPQFAGNVGFVETRDYWRWPIFSPGEAGHHWNENGESYYLIGNSMGEQMIELVPEPGSAVMLGLAGLILARRRR